MIFILLVIILFCFFFGGDFFGSDCIVISEWGVVGWLIFVVVMLLWFDIKNMF